MKIRIILSIFVAVAFLATTTYAAPPTTKKDSKPTVTQTSDESQVKTDKKSLETLKMEKADQQVPTTSDSKTSKVDKKALHSSNPNKTTAKGKTAKTKVSNAGTSATSAKKTDKTAQPKSYEPKK